MKRIGVLLLLVLAFTFNSHAQTTYYVSVAGNDANDGRSDATAFRTIDKINTLSLQPGDKVLFRRGDTFRGALVIQQSGNANNPISVDAYGTGNKPVLSGSALVSSWSSVGANLWQATCSSCGSTITGLYNNDSPLPLGRYPNLNAPNKGYLTIQSHSSNNQFVSQEPLTTDWTGGEVVYRPVLWILNRATITQQSGNTLTINNSASAYNLANGWGYFIQNHPATLDQNGEWYYNPATKIIRLFSTQDPNSQAITATVYSQGVSLLNVSYVSVRNLVITQTLNIGLYAANSSNSTITAVDITNSGENAMALHGSGNNMLVESNTIDRPNNNGVEIQTYNNLTFRNNSVKRVALVPGRGKSGDGQYRGVDVGPTVNLLMETNQLDSIGYTGISFSTLTSGATIRRNIISNYCYTKSDGGGIYTFNGTQQAMSNIKIQSNIVFNAFGATEGAPAGVYSGGNGIAMGECVQNVEITDNTVFSCYGIGIFVAASNNIIVRRNTSFDNREGQFVMAYSGTICPPRNNTVKNNVFVGKQPTQSIARYESIENDLNLYGDIDSNYYARPLDDVLKIGAGFKDVDAITNNTYGLRDWQRLYGKDLNTKESPITYPGFTINALTGPNRIGNGTFNNDATEWYPQSYYNNGQVGWDNNNRLDGGSLRIFFQPASGYKASYVFVVHGIDAITQGKSYVLKFDAIASANGKTLETFIRKRFAPSQDLAIRVGAVVGTTRQHYEIAFTATQSEADAIVIFRVLEDGGSVWLDNISFQEAAITRSNPDDLIKLVYNPTVNNLTVNLDGTYRDVKNQVYSGQIILAPFASVVLLRDTDAGVDLQLTLLTDKETSPVGATNTLRVRIRNTSLTGSATATWVCRLPPNVTFVGGAGISNNNGVLSGQVSQLGPQAEVVFPFQVQLTAPGTYRVASEILTASRPDPDSTPGSGTADGEDDAATITLRTTQTSSAVFVSPNPNQRALPPVIQTQPAPPAGQADLMLAFALSTRVLTVNQIVSVTVTVANIGAKSAMNVQLQDNLPTGLQFVSGTGWTANGALLTTNVGTVDPGTVRTLIFTARAIASGTFINRAQITASSETDPDSQPANGTTNGEDDQAQVDFRVR